MERNPDNEAMCIEMRLSSAVSASLDRRKTPAARDALRPEIGILVELIARSVYERWKAGEPLAGAPVGPE